MNGSLWLIGIGLFIWLINLGIFSFWQWGRDWPWILILIGFSGLLKEPYKRHRKNKKEARRSRSPEDIKEILEKVEKGEISADDAVKGIKEEK